MNKSNGIFQNRNTLILVIALLAIVCLEAILVVVLINRKPEAKPDDASTSSAVVSENKGEINTPVGKLVFPSEWADSVEIKDTSSGKQFRKFHSFHSDGRIHFYSSKYFLTVFLVTFNAAAARVILRSYFL